MDRDTKSSIQTTIGLNERVRILADARSIKLGLTTNAKKLSMSAYLEMLVSDEEERTKDATA